MPAARIVVAGTSSGVGKTSISCGIIYGLSKMGYRVQPFKAGPDYIDPGYLSAAASTPAFNLDAWIMGKKGVQESLSRNSTRDISVIEGVMGMYDGFDGKRNLASTHHIARITDSPIILVVDARGAARSVAATVLGFERFSKRSHIMAVILNNLGSHKHEVMCKDAIAPLGIPVVGAVPRNSEVRWESRHLGLVPVAEDPTAQKSLAESSAFIADHMDLDRILHIARLAPPMKKHAARNAAKTVASVGVALDGSFNFYYPDNLERLRDAGARLHFFSPESDTLPDVDGLYIGGGFPEVRGSILQKNQCMLDMIKKSALEGVPIYAECGGLMYLSKYIRQDQERFRMVGLFDTVAVMGRSATLGYTKGVMDGGLLVGSATRFRGHEFHYSRLENIPSDSEFAQSLSIGTGICDKKDGLVTCAAMASYGHLHLDSRAAKNMVERCRTYSKR